MGSEQKIFNYGKDFMKNLSRKMHDNYTKACLKLRNVPITKISRNAENCVCLKILTAEILITYLVFVIKSKTDLRREWSVE